LFYYYFLSGNASDIKPLTLKDLAQELNMDVSTMSRALQAKYFETPWGLVGSRTLFGEKTTKSDGEEVSTKALKEQLAQIIAGENPEKPYSDEELGQKLTETGFLVARRTVTKYREHMGIAVGRLRKK
jgi:RNA polymerase sigma-54 factor